jgi:DNA-binding MarR family transcriptional regulator
VDIGMGITPPQASALSVLVFGGPRTLAGLAAAEQVKPPTMSRLVAAMERAGLATKTADARDGRVVHIAATGRGRRLLEAGRERRLAQLTAELALLSPRDRAVLMRATAILEAMTPMNGGKAAAASTPRAAAGARI